MVLAVWTSTARHGEPCMSARGTAKHESSEFVLLDKGDAALFAVGGQDENALSISPLSAWSCEEIRPVRAPGLQRRHKSLQIIGGGVPSRRFFHEF
jgi:hypothetical protein